MRERAKKMRRDREQQQADDALARAAATIPEDTPELVRRYVEAMGLLLFVARSAHANRKAAAVAFEEMMAAQKRHEEAIEALRADTEMAAEAALDAARAGDAYRKWKATEDRRKEREAMRGDAWMPSEDDPEW